MKFVSQSVAGRAGVLSLGLLLGAIVVQAQNQGPRPPGNFNPQQMRQRMLDRLRDRFEVQDDAEWKIISERLVKVMDAKREVARLAGGAGGPGGFGGMGGPGGPAGPGGFGGMGGPGGPPPAGPDSFRGPGGSRAQDNEAAPGSSGPQRPNGRPGFAGGPNDRRGPGRPGGFNGESAPELEALRKALDNKASASEIKATLTQLREARQKADARLENTQEALREILSARQEALAVLLGLLK